MYDITSLFEIEADSIEKFIKEAEESRDKKITLHSGQVVGNLMGNEGRESIDQNNPIKPHIDKLNELDLRQQDFKRFRELFDKLSQEESEKFEKRFKKFQAREFGDRDYLNPYDLLSKDHEKIQKELIGYGREIQQQRKQEKEQKLETDFNVSAQSIEQERLAKRKALEVVRERKRQNRKDRGRKRRRDRGR